MGEKRNGPRRPDGFAGSPLNSTSCVLRLARRAAHGALQITGCATAGVLFGLGCGGRRVCGGRRGGSAAAAALLGRDGSTAALARDGHTGLGARLRGLFGGAGAGRRWCGRNFRRRRGRGCRRGCGRGRDRRRSWWRWRRTQHEYDRDSRDGCDRDTAADEQTGLVLGLRGAVVGGRCAQPATQRRSDAQR